MYWIRDNLDSTAFSLAGGQILLSFPVTELMSKVRSNCLTEASTFLYQYVGCWYWGMCFYRQMPLSLKNIHKAANKPTPVENPEQRWSDVWLVPVLMVSSQRQQIQWLKPTNWAEHLISHWFTAWPSPHPFQQIMQSLPLFFLTTWSGKYYLGVSLTHTNCENQLIFVKCLEYTVWAELRETMVITHSFHFPAHLKQFLCLRWSDHTQTWSPSNPCLQ